MAVDTAQKRRSILSFARMNYAERVPEATNFDSAADRGQGLYLYFGIEPGGGAAPQPGGGSGGKVEKFWWFFRRRR